VITEAAIALANPLRVLRTEPMMLLDQQLVMPGPPADGILDAFGKAGGMVYPVPLGTLLRLRRLSDLPAHRSALIGRCRCASPLTDGEGRARHPPKKP
jgi:hypothetical protein